MNKKTVLILSLIFSILFLIYIILEYIGIIRYFMLHFMPIEYYISKLPSIPKADTQRVIISFTSEPGKLNKIKPFINSLLDQSVKVDEIALSLPYSHMGNVPPNIKKIVDVYGHSKDYEKAANFIPALLREGDARTKIIIVEPNIIYGKDFIEHLIRHSNTESKKIISHKNAILIKPEFFDDRISDYHTGNNHMSWLEKYSNVSSIPNNYYRNYKMWL